MHFSLVSSLLHIQKRFCKLISPAFSSNAKYYHKSGRHFKRCFKFHCSVKFYPQEQQQVCKKPHESLQGMLSTQGSHEFNVTSNFLETCIFVFHIQMPLHFFFFPHSTVLPNLSHYPPSLVNARVDNCVTAQAMRAEFDCNLKELRFPDCMP